MRRRADRSGKEDDRPPICPACGVTQGMVVTDDGTRFVCLECGFSDDSVVGAVRLFMSMSAHELQAPA